MVLWEKFEEKKYLSYVSSTPEAYNLSGESNTKYKRMNNQRRGYVEY